jgi:hypothetical protein
MEEGENALGRIEMTTLRFSRAKRKIDDAS